MYACSQVQHHIIIVIAAFFVLFHIEGLNLFWSLCGLLLLQGALGLELWSMSSDILFDNFIIADNKRVADLWANDSWALKHVLELELSAAQVGFQILLLMSALNYFFPRTRNEHEWRILEIIFTTSFSNCFVNWKFK